MNLPLLLIQFTLLSLVGLGQNNAQVNTIDSVVAIINSTCSIQKNDSGSYSLPVLTGGKDLQQEFRKEFYFNSNRALGKVVSYSGTKKANGKWVGKTTYYFHNDTLVKYIDEVNTDHGPESLIVYLQNQNYLHANLPREMFDMEGILRSARRSLMQGKKYFK